MTKKQLLFKIMPMAIALITLVLIAFSCSAFNTKSINPEITSPDDNFVTLGSLSLSNEKVYNTLVDQHGAKEVRYLVDKELLSNGTKDYLALAKEDDEFNVQEELEKTMFNGFTLNEVKELMTAEDIETLKKSFEEILIYNGYASVEDYKEDLYLEHAKTLYTKDELLRDYNKSSNDEPTITLED